LTRFTLSITFSSSRAGLVSWGLVSGALAHY